MTIRALTLEGTPDQIGEAHGESLRGEIHACFDVWAEHLARTYRSHPRDLVAGFLGATTLMRTAARLTPDLDVEMTAIARGAGVDVDMLRTWNLLDELWWYAESIGETREDVFRPLHPMSCSSLGVRVGASGDPIVAQNMDLESFVTWDPVLLRLRPTNGIDALVMVNPGDIGLCGCNAAGVAVTCNALGQLPPSGDGLPVSFVVRAILGEPDLASAQRHVRSIPHASGQNYLLGSPEGVIDFECSAAQVSELGEGEATIVHTNHAVASPGVEGSGTPNSFERLRFLEAAIHPEVGVEAIEAVLSDRSVPVCKTSADPVRTYASIVMELSVPPAVRVTPGPPERGAYEDIAF